MSRWKYILKGIDPDTGQEVEVGVNPDNNGMIILNKVYDPDILDWVNMQQPQLNIQNADLTASFGDVEALLAGTYWKSTRREWGTGFSRNQLNYLGLNITLNASITSPTWYITKYTWSNRNPVYEQGPIVGAWSDRATLGW